MRVPGQKFFVPASRLTTKLAGMARSYVERGTVCSGAATGGLIQSTGIQW